MIYFIGAQPITNRAQNIALSVNGEIYNHIELLEELKEIVPDIQSEFTTDSDCEVLLHLFKVFLKDIYFIQSRGLNIALFAILCF